jgi:hypothetical protein
MKKIIVPIICASIAVLASCGNGGNKAESNDSTSVDSIAVVVDSLSTDSVK